jgi:hypothetical protein
LSRKLFDLANSVEVVEPPAAAFVHVYVRGQYAGANEYPIARDARKMADRTRKEFCGVGIDCVVTDSEDDPRAPTRFSAAEVADASYVGSAEEANATADDFSRADLERVLENAEKRGDDRAAALAAFSGILAGRIAKGDEASLSAAAEAATIAGDKFAKAWAKR